jgi:hypothetical protein
VTRRLTHTKAQERKAPRRAASFWQPLIDATLPPEVPMKKQYGFKSAQRGKLAGKFPALKGKDAQAMHPRIVNVSFDVTQEVAAALRALRGTGLFGNGVDCATVAEELLRRALLQPGVLEYWQHGSRGVR